LIAQVLSVGNEIISGRIADTNAAYISNRLESLGVDVIRHVAVGDDLAALIEELLDASERFDLILITGGIGPTRDDITRQAVAAAAGVELELHEPSLEHIRERFRSFGLPHMPQTNRVQAYLPKGSTLIHNPNGTAAGFRMQINRAHVAVLPGVPPEMVAMFEESVVPFVRTLLPRGVHVTGSLECFGMSESLIDEKVHDLMDPTANPLVGLLANSGQITVKITARAGDEATAGRLVVQTKAEVRKRLGGAVLGEDGQQLEHVVGQMLAARGLTIATAESCTGGLIAKKLTDVPGSSAYFLRGYVTYSNPSKTDLLGVSPELLKTAGAVSEAVARAMAQGARAAAGAGIAVSATGIAGPSGGSAEKPVGLVFIGIADEAGSEVQRYELRGDRERIRERTARLALDMVRRRLEK